VRYRYLALVLLVAVVFGLFAVAVSRARAADGFEVARAVALADGKPLLIFVRQPALAVAGCVSCRLESYPGQDYPGVVICIPDGSGGLVEAGRRDCYPSALWLERRVAELRAEHARLYLRLGLGLDFRLGLGFGFGLSIGRPAGPYHPHGPHRGK
jgi:hypothetical protein